MSASFWLEAGIVSDNGTGQATNSNNQATGTTVAPNGTQGLTFNRRSTISLAGNWGELRLGRDFSLQFYNRFQFDPYGGNGVGTSQVTSGSLGGLVSSRASNAIYYYLPANSSGLYGGVQYYLGENPSNAGATSNDGDGAGVRVGYKAGPVNIAISHARTQYVSTATTGDIASSSIAGSYDFGNITAMGGYYRDKVGTLSGLTGHGPQIGGIYRIGVGEIKALYSSYKTTAAGGPETKKVSLGYVHNLSKRTALYGTYAHVRNSGGATTVLNGAITAANQSSTGLDLGIRHAF